jgi:hypothetical protein
MAVRTLAIGTALALALTLLAACSSFTEVEDSGVEGDGSHRADAKPEDGAPPPQGDGFTPGGTGPGPWGALPSGYCCATDNDCRFRKCVDFNGSKMCMDPCTSDDGCAGTVSGLRCNEAKERCEPDAQSQQCTPADKYQYGSRKLGACCLATHDGWAGRECEGNHCVSFYGVENPYICTHACAKPSDCVGSYMCSNTGYGYGLCVPLAQTYTCE